MALNPIIQLWNLRDVLLKCHTDGKEPVLRKEICKYLFRAILICSTIPDIMKLKNGLLLLFFLLLGSVCFNVESQCIKGCDLALASYYVQPGVLLQNITRFMQSKIVPNSDVITSYNKDKVFNGEMVVSLNRTNIPFPCDCIGGEFLGHVFEYSAAAGDTYDFIAKMRYANLTTVELLQRFNSYDPNHIPVNAKVNVTVNCSCGNNQISKDYGLFITYPLRPGNNLQELANETNVDAELL